MVTKTCLPRSHTFIFFEKITHLIRLFVIRMTAEKPPTPLTWMALMPQECTSWVGEKVFSDVWACKKTLLMAVEIAVNLGY